MDYQDLVKSEYVKGHISRLLSYTLKMGDGGAAIERQQSDPSTSSKPSLVAVPDRSRSEGGLDVVNKSSEVGGNKLSTTYTIISIKSILYFDGRRWS